MRVDFPAPFSPIRACTSPGNSRKSTPSSALTPGNVMEIPVIATMGAGSCVVTAVSVIVDLSSAPVSRYRQAGAARGRGGPPGQPGREGLVLAVGQDCLRARLVERLVLGDDARVDGAAVLERLDDLGEVRAAAAGCTRRCS